MKLNSPIFSRNLNDSGESVSTPPKSIQLSYTEIGPKQ